MKKFLVLLAAIFCSSIMFAQSIVSPSKDLGLSLKSISKVNGDVEYTVLLTNKTSEEIVVNLVGGQYQTGMAGSVAYDNEGNIYDLANVLVSAGKMAYTEQYCGVNIPGGVSVKCHVIVKGVDPAANEMTKLKICILCPQLQISNTGVCFELNNMKF